jgi:predicted DCC family thiol-disulfide oxidoreductase YuxK
MIPIDMPRDANGWVVLYDPDCGFCRWSLGWVLAREPGHVLRPLALGTPEADELLHDLTPAQRAASFHLVEPGGRRLSAGAAAPPLLRLLRGGRGPAAVLATAPKATERAYRFVANHRSWFGKLVSARAKARADQLIVRRQAADSAGT